ncbi:MAG: Lrp/AsnC family transcriptional regulator [Saccharolobus sp.]|uniref:siroheme decarboxylase n=2 Tax=Saccharolobus shibatae TaxID=2286 RepID=A0A8F5BL03_SACSH|nr:Lrp/AsnC family transcriptional regulator [Saccharolobus shibatae]MCH4814431.1 Lrp/AsnC family transcriptional regulator [Saccharolobus shibatae]QXJ27159.1 Siroheme decarboxylase AhbA, alternate heme biosynthesis pathway [Saccharolobus shibatae B12]QXJ33482.1 Siroheme decarboxylase AhbA, alternate heme biosynthesis pathway [Saccharolobus shibatae]
MDLSEISDIDKEILMKLEYNFPFDPQPFKIISEELKISEEELLNRIKKLLEDGIVKRIGMYVSFRAKGMDGALIAARIPQDKIEKFRKIALGIKELTHNYVRDHPKYNIWFVLKASDRDTLNKNVKELLSQVDCNDYVILYSKRTLKLSVKYDVIRGVSWSPNNTIKSLNKVPTAEELGIDKQLLTELSYPLKISQRPFKEIAEKHKMKEDELIELVRELYDKNVIKDYGATLNGEKIGIVENGMVLLDTSNIEKSCEKLALNIPEATHVVLRESNDEDWKYLCYSMIHASRKETIRNVAKEISKETDSRSYMILFSLENLKPGIVI